MRDNLAGMSALIAGKYELVAPVGEGGMASVWRGLVHGAAGFTKLVAIKRVRPDLAAERNFTLRFFVEEARVVSALQHLEHRASLRLRSRRSRRVLHRDGVGRRPRHVRLGARTHVQHGLRSPWHLVTGIMIERCCLRRDLRARAHRRVRPQPGAGDPLRDINPANILLGASGHVKLADFGLARAMDRVSMTTSPAW